MEDIDADMDESLHLILSSSDEDNDDAKIYQVQGRNKSIAEKRARLENMVLHHPFPLFEKRSSWQRKQSGPREVWTKERAAHFMHHMVRIIIVIVIVIIIHYLV